MNKKLGRLFHPGMGIYFAVMLGFCLVALLMDQLLLAVSEAVVTLMIFVLYMFRKKQRHNQLQQYIQSIPGAIESVSKGESPFPTVMARLGDGGIIWANDQFSAITGFSDSMLEYTLTDVLPEFSIDWLASGKTESPYDVTLDGRRYRVYGTSIRADDPAGTMLGVFYFSDLTMLYQVRDEYIRSRPVVSIILIDNYEELTKNLAESAISALNAKLGDTITEWTDGYHGLLRKLERNRFLFVFEKRDLDRATEEKFSLLENIHQIMSPSGLPASLSIGLGVDGANFEESYNFAALGIEMALSRGGDQAVAGARKPTTAARSVPVSPPIP